MATIIDHAVGQNEPTIKMRILRSLDTLTAEPDDSDWPVASSAQGRIAVLDKHTRHFGMNFGNYELR